MEGYWEKRADALYYQVVRILTQTLAAQAKSIIDIGSGNCPYLDWFENVPKRVSLDLRTPYNAPGVIAYKKNIFDWRPDETYDVVMCLQVLEHIPSATKAAQKLLAMGRVVVVSVPYKWPYGRTSGHVHDPVDEAKMLTWFGREPNFTYLCREVVNDSDRLINVYERNDYKWATLDERASQRRQRMQARAAAAATPAPLSA